MAGRIAELIPNSKYLETLSKKLDMQATDHRLGMALSHTSPWWFTGYGLSETLKSPEFADYARSLALPHIALVIEAGIKDPYRSPRVEPPQAPQQGAQPQG